VNEPTPCPYCGKPQTADHWQRIAHAWEHLVTYALTFGFILGAGIVGIVWAAVDHR
jgi:hypothetical protein